MDLLSVILGTILIIWFFYLMSPGVTYKKTRQDDEFLNQNLKK